MAHVIQIQPDVPALLAARLVLRLQRDGFISREVTRQRVNAITEALADEIHQATVDGTLGCGQ